MGEGVTGETYTAEDAARISRTLRRRPATSHRRGGPTCVQSCGLLRMQQFKRLRRQVGGKRDGRRRGGEEERRRGEAQREGKEERRIVRCVVCGGVW